MQSNSSLGVVIHSLGLALFGYSLYYDLKYVNPPPQLLAQNKHFEEARRWPGKWKYLTVWNIVIQIVYNVVALLNDAFGSSELNKSRQTFLQKVRDVYFASWVFPTGMFVCVAFWGLSAMGEAFMIVMPSFFPMWLNHTVHTLPVVLITLESVVVPHSHQKHPLPALTLIFGIGFYLSWIHWVNHVSNVWPYPVLTLLPPLQRSLFMAAAGVVILLFYLLGEALNKWRWAHVSEKRKKKK